MSRPRPTLPNRLPTAETRPAFALLGLQSLRQTHETVYTAAWDGFVWIRNVRLRGANHATGCAGYVKDFGFGGRGRILVLVADGAGPFGQEG